MRNFTRHLYRGAFVVGVLCTAWLALNMVAIPVYREQVFLERGTIGPGGETLILVGFIFIALFNLVSLVWVSSHARDSATSR
jgi:hypothetical protein